MLLSHGPSHAAFVTGTGMSAWKSNDRVYLEAEDRILCPSDVSLDNSLRVWDPEAQQVSMINFQHTIILPKSFFSFYPRRSSDPFVQAVAAKIGFPVSLQLGLLASGAGIIISASVWP